MPGGKFMRARADGGAADTVAGDPADADAAYRWPEWVPDTNVVLFTIARGNQFDIAAMSLDSNKREVLIKGGTQPRYAGTGHVVYAQQVSADGRVRGAGAASFAIATTGTLVYLPGEPFERRQLAWVDREGRGKPLGDVPRVYRSPKISPDGQRIAVHVADPNRGLHLYDIAQGSWNQLPLEPGRDAGPLWSPDSRRLAYSSDELGQSFVTSLDDLKTSKRLPTPAGRHRLSSWSPDGKTLAVEVFDDVTGLDIWTVPVDGNAPAAPWLKTTSGESEAAFSPDGRWMVYQSNMSGRAAIYIRPFPGPGNQLQVTQAGSNPIWTKDGRELIFRQGMSLFAVDVTTTPALSVSAPKLLFRGRFGVDFDATRDGSAFVMLDPVQEQIAENQLIVVLDWFGELTRRMRGVK
ncbi:MAG TPA: hypothetical protein VES67_03105 [Vicinamibacterales bacterium]|nr:hypothetical protein [Vicinamibacterales bacterium]